MKTTGELWMRFLNDTAYWPQGAYMDDVLLLVNGEAHSNEMKGAQANLEDLPSNAEIVIQSGFVFVDRDTSDDLDRFFRKWLESSSRLENTAKSQLEPEFQESEATDYVAWLEEQLISARSQMPASADQDARDARRYRALRDSGKYAPSQMTRGWGLSMGGRHHSSAADLDASADQLVNEQ